MAARSQLFLAVAIGLSLWAQERNEQDLKAALEHALAGGQPDRAGPLVKQLVTQPRIELDTLLEVGGKLADRDLFDLAGEVFTRAVSLYPKSFEARYSLALSDFALRRFTEAQAALDYAEPLSSEQQLNREYLRGKLYDALGQTDLAERSFSTAFQGLPQQENFALDLGLHYVRRHLYAKAIATLSTAAKYHPDSVYLELELGLAQLLGDDRSKAIDTSRRVLAKEPKFGPARLLLAVAYYLNGDNQRCLAETSAALQQPDASPYLSYLHAASLLKLNSTDYPLMLRDLDQANRQIPGCALCYLTQSKVHQGMGEDAAAVVDLETLVTRVDPEFAQGWYRLSKMYSRGGRPDDAGKALERFRKINSKQDAEEMEHLRKLLLSALGAE